MAMRHRKLFPAPTPTNQTVDCPDFCDPACPDNCYPYPDYFFPPPPPSPPSPSLLSQEHHLSPYVIIIVSILASLVLLVSYYLIVVKSSSSWCGLRSNRQPGGPADDTDEEFLDENGVDHPIWYITTIGLQQSIINSITVCRYKKGEGLVEGSECSVCLSEFQQDETLRLLPKCNHAFHISCIDTWLRSHTNCPLCRAHIVSDAVGHPPVSVNQQPENLQTIVSTETENAEVGTESSYALDRNENGAGAEGVREVVQVSDDIISKENVNADGNGEVQILCDSGDNDQAVKDDIQLMRRYFTTDSLTAAASIFLRPPIHKPIESEGGTSGDETENEEEIHSINVLKRDGRWSSSFRLLRSSSIAQCLHKAPVPMKRSYSCGSRFFPSRQSGSLNSVLPL